MRYGCRLPIHYFQYPNALLLHKLSGKWLNHALAGCSTFTAFFFLFKIFSCFATHSTRPMKCMTIAHCPLLCVVNIAKSMQKSWNEFIKIKIVFVTDWRGEMVATTTKHSFAHSKLSEQRPTIFLSFEKKVLLLLYYIWN